MFLIEEIEKFAKAEEQKVELSEMRLVFFFFCVSRLWTSKLEKSKRKVRSWMERLSKFSLS